MKQSFCCVGFSVQGLIGAKSDSCSIRVASGGDVLQLRLSPGDDRTDAGTQRCSEVVIPPLGTHGTSQRNACVCPSVSVAERAGADHRAVALAVESMKYDFHYGVDFKEVKRVFFNDALHGPTSDPCLNLQGSRATPCRVRLA